jgi:apolipoprotein N-acyltransferase
MHTPPSEASIIAEYMHRTRWKETGWAALSGVLMAMAMPGFGVSVLVFVALVPWLHAQGRTRRILPGAVCGLVFFALDLRWLLTLVRFTPLVVLGYLLLIGLLAASLGVVGALIGEARRRLGDGIGLLLVAPIALSLLEIVRAQGELSLGFSTLFAALHRLPVLIQGASLFGPWALSAAVVLVNGALALGLRRGRRGIALSVALAAIGGMLILAALPTTEDGDPLAVSVIGSDVTQEIKLRGTEMETLLPLYLGLGREAAAAAPELIVYPESILPVFLLRDPVTLERFAELARAASARILLGTGHYEDGKLTNRVILLSASGEVVDSYAMMHPVPFGETIPGRAILEWLGLAGWLRQLLPMDLTRGTEYTLLDGIGAPICFESTFPDPSRRFAQRGATLLITVTNDAWFIGSSELPAHFASAVFRAVETRRYVVQAANGGVSGIVDPRGRVMTSAVGEIVLHGHVAHRDVRSAYTRYGELPLLVLFATSLAASLAWRFGRRAPVRGSARPHTAQ